MSSGTAVFVVGPAGSGKSTLCAALMQHCETIGRSAHLINLDPAAENFEYEPSKDIRDLITVGDVMEEFGYGPNGGLIFAMEYLLSNVEWLKADLGQYQDEFLLVDCPGQVELYTHSQVIRSIIDTFRSADYRVCVVWLIDAAFIGESTRFFGACLMAMSAMLQLGCSHINVISKFDLLKPVSEQTEDEEDDLFGLDEDGGEFHRYFYPDPTLLQEDLGRNTRPAFHRLNEALTTLLDDYNLVNFIPLSVKRESCLAMLLNQIDNATQFTENLEPKEPHDFGDEYLEDEPDGGISDVD